MSEVNENRQVRKLQSRVCLRVVLLLLALTPLAGCITTRIPRTVRSECREIYNYIAHETRGLRFSLSAAIVREDQYSVRYYQRWISVNERRLAQLRAGSPCSTG